MSAREKPWLSVLIPTYNGERYIAEALDSICMQAEEGVQCIVVDDGSSDATISIVESYSEKLALTVMRRPRRGSWVRGTNDALQAATGDHVCLLHQDDYWLPGRLQRMKALIRQAPDCACYLHAVNFVGPGREPLGRWSSPLPATPAVCASATLMERLIVQNFIAINAPIFKRASAVAIGGWNEALWYTADWDFWLRLARSGSTAYVPDSLAAFRIHPGSQTVIGAQRIVDFREQMVHVQEQHLSTMAMLKPEVVKAARFSTQVNAALAAASQGSGSGRASLLLAALQLGPRGWFRFLRDSRIHQRLFARLRALPG